MFYRLKHMYACVEIVLIQMPHCFYIYPFVCEKSKCAHTCIIFDLPQKTRDKKYA